MASTYSTNLALELIGTGDQAGTWGNTTNTNLGTLIEQAISGYVTQGVTTGTTATITIPNGSTGVARNMYIELTGTGGSGTVLLVPSNKKLYFIYNNSSGAVTVRVSGQTGISVASTEKKILVSNGTDIVDATTYIISGGSANLTTLTAASANITTLTATSANITTLTGTTFGNTGTTNLRGVSGNITTLTGTSATITNISSTSLTISNETVIGTSVDWGLLAARLYVSNGSTTLSGTSVFESTLQPRPCIFVANTATSGNNALIQFNTDTFYDPRGSITYNRSAGQVAYNTTSDRRAKSISGPVTNSGQVIDQLKVYNGKMNWGTIEFPMMIADEAQQTTPYCVTGQPNAVDEIGKPVYQQMDYSALVPLLIAEIQSLRARVATLEATP